MPEAAMDEYDYRVMLKYEVWRTRQRPVVRTKVKAKRP